MQLPRLGRQRTPEYVDLSDEQPTERALLEIKFTPDGWVSTLGHAVIFAGKARALAGTMHVDMEALASTLREPVPSLALVVHDEHEAKGVAGGIPVSGWHRDFEQILIRSRNDNEHLLFTHALHVIAGAPSPNHTVLHEAGHLDDFLAGIEPRILYTPENIRKFRLAGLGLAAISLACSGFAAFNAGEHTSTTAQVLTMSMGAMGALGSVAGAKLAPQILWIQSPAEFSANQFAAHHKQTRIFTSDEQPRTTYLNVAVEDIEYGRTLAGFFDEHKDKARNMCPVAANPYAHLEGTTGTNAS